jgi:hypothetical protein
VSLLATLGDAVDRLLGQRRASEEPAAVERLVRARFRFLEERQGFELAVSTPLDDGAVAAYVNHAAHRAVAVFARRTRGVWTGIGAVPEDGRVPPVNRETIADGLWREFRRVDLAGDRSLADALDEAAASLGDRRAA